MSPKIKVGRRGFVLCFIERLGRRPGAQDEVIIGHFLGVHFGKKDKPNFIISSCTTEWEAVSNLKSFDSLEEAMLIAEIFYEIEPKEWRICHPEQGESLYSNPKTTIEKMHTRIVEDLFWRRKIGSQADYYRSQAVQSGAVDSDEEK